MFSRCIRCNKPFPKNSEIDDLPLGRRIAFDTEKGRLWVVCTHCEQWNLVPLEERWEAVEQCERLAASAEAMASTSKLGIAQTASGLELLRVGGLSRNDIANSRYGRRLVERQRLLAWIALSSALLAIVFGLRAGMAAGSAAIGVYIAVIALMSFVSIWKDPQYLSTHVLHAAGKRLWIFPWQVQDMYIDARDKHAGPQLVIPGPRTRRFAEGEAAHVLAQLLPKLNGAQCATASVRTALAKVARAEHETDAHLKSAKRKQRHHRAHEHDQPRVLRPWERLIPAGEYLRLTEMLPEDRLALEMAVIEEIERQDLIADAEQAGEEWPEQEEIAGISDSLLVPPEVEHRLRELKEESSDAGSPAPSSESKIDE